MGVLFIREYADYFFIYSGELFGNLFWITHPTKYLGALSKRECEDNFFYLSLSPFFQVGSLGKQRERQTRFKMSHGQTHSRYLEYQKKALLVLDCSAGYI